MLRASLAFASALTVATISLSGAAQAGPHHQPPHRAAVHAVSAVAGSAAIRVRQRVVRPPVMAGATFIGYPAAFFPISRPVRTIFVSAAASDHPGDVTPTLNPVPVVIGIRRPAEAAPIIYRIDDSRHARGMRHHNRQRMAPSAGVHHVVADTTTPRIVVVRGR